MGEEYKMGDAVLGRTTQEKDLGVTFNADMKVSEQCRIAASKDLTRFNKICHPSQRPRWQVDKEAIGLSRVQQCSFTYNPPS